MSLYPANPTGLPARRAALKLLDAVLRRGEPLESALHAATQGLGQRADRALTHAIVAAVLRYMPDPDALIDAATRQPLPEDAKARARSEEHTSELQSLMRISYAVFCLKKKKNKAENESK